MSKSTTGAAATGDASNTAQSRAALATRFFQKAFANMSPADRRSALADALIAAGADSGVVKATYDIMDGKEPDIHVVEDLWAAGSDGMPPHKRVSGGASGNHAGGDIITGPSVQSSGGGVTEMGGEYSHPAPQYGSQVATERLGELLKSVRAAIKALAMTSKAQSDQVALLQSAMGVLIDDVGSAKALAQKAITKAESERDSAGGNGHETEEEEADEEAEQSESGGEVEVEITNEIEDDEEGETDADGAKAKAVRSRVLAKNRLRLAKDRITKALDAEMMDKPKSAKRHRNVAKEHAAKAATLIATAKSLRPDSTKLAALEKMLRTIGKALPKAESDNQDEWPASEGKRPGKTSKTSKTDPVTDETAKSLNAMQAQLDASLKGLGMFQGTVASLLETVGGRNMQRAGGVTPPAVQKGAVAHAGVAGDIASVREAIGSMHDNGIVGNHDADAASDILDHIDAIKHGLPLDGAILKARIARMPAIVKPHLEAALAVVGNAA